ncbi:hypothetical protein ACQ4PT_017228 [Festuca glaucescens]
MDILGGGAHSGMDQFIGRGRIWPLGARSARSPPTTTTSRSRPPWICIERLPPPPPPPPPSRPRQPACYLSLAIEIGGAPPASTSPASEVPLPAEEEHDDEVIADRHCPLALREAHRRIFHNLALRTLWLDLPPRRLRLRPVRCWEQLGQGPLHRGRRAH